MQDGKTKQNKKPNNSTKNKPRDNGVRGSAENWLNLGVSWAAGCCTVDVTQICLFGKLASVLALAPVTPSDFKTQPIPVAVFFFFSPRHKERAAKISKEEIWVAQLNLNLR